MAQAVPCYLPLAGAEVILKDNPILQSAGVEVFEKMLKVTGALLACFLL